MDRTQFTWQDKTYTWIPLKELREKFEAMRWCTDPSNTKFLAIKSSYEFVQKLQTATEPTKRFRYLQSARYWQTVYWDDIRHKAELKRQRLWARQFPDIFYEQRHEYITKCGNMKTFKELYKT